MIIELLGPTGADIFYVTICLVCCLGVCTLCECLKSSTDKKIKKNTTLKSIEIDLPRERQTEASDWVALSERKKIKSEERNKLRDEERKIA